MARLLMAALIATALGCSNHDSSISTIPSIEQGIWGRVELWGDSSTAEVDSQTLSGRISYSSQRLYVFTKTHHEQLTPDTIKGPVYFKRISSNMVATTRSDDRGYFEVSLPVGEYSVFVEVAGRLYANHFDDDGFAEPVEICESELVRCGIRIMPQPSDQELLAAP